MKKKSSEQADRLRESIQAASQKSKENIRNIIDSYSRQFDAALDANKKFIDSLEKQIFNADFMDTTILSDVKKTFGNTVELSEEAIDALLDIQSAQADGLLDYNSKLVEKINSLDLSDKESIDELMQAIQENLENSSRQLTDNTKKITDLYNKHLNLAVNFQEKFSKNINSQMQALSRFQSRNVDMFNDWATHWWKSAAREEATV